MADDEAVNFVLGVDPAAFAALLVKCAEGYRGARPGQWADREGPAKAPETAPEAPGPTSGRRAIVREGEPEV